MAKKPEVQQLSCYSCLIFVLELIAEVLNQKAAENQPKINQKDLRS